MTVEETRFITDMLRGIRAELGDVRREQVNQGLRITAIEQIQHGLMTQMLAVQSSLNDLSSGMRRVKQRLELAEE